MNFEIDFAKLIEQCPYSIHVEPHNWAKWMQLNGYGRRLHAGLLNSRIVAEIIAVAECEAMSGLAGEQSE